MPFFQWNVITLLAGGGGDIAGTDLLTCGHCKTKFPLQELVAYIQHKATNCTKQDSDLSNGMEDKQDNKSLEVSVSHSKSRLQ